MLKPRITLKRTNQIYEDQRTKTKNTRKIQRLMEVKRKDRITFTRHQELVSSFIWVKTVITSHYEKD